MYGDFSRLRFSRFKQYSAVLAQQGRPQLDADLNEQVAIFLDYMRTLAVDFIGPFGGNVDRAGFKVTVVPSSQRESSDLVVSPGHYYVYGLRCEVPVRNELGHPQELSYRRQQLGPGGADPLPAPPFFVFLAVWEHMVGVTQDPDLLEPALGPNPPDTTLRSKVSWEVAVSDRLPGRDSRLTGSETRAEIMELFERFDARAASGGSLRARTAHVEAEGGPVLTPSIGGYRGVENQLYRVEIHSSGAGEGVTFKWSRENGCMVFPIRQLVENRAVVTTLGRDSRSDLEIGDWVEIVDDSWTPWGDAPPLLHVADIDRTTLTVTLGGGDIDVAYRDAATHPFLRRWDQRPERSQLAPDNALRVEESTEADPHWMDLEDGIQVQFVEWGHKEPLYRRGQYWLIPARTATGGILWPVAEAGPVARPPDGPAHYVAPLALVKAIGNDPKNVLDLRSLFVNLAFPEEDEER